MARQAHRYRDPQCLATGEEVQAVFGPWTDPPRDGASIGEKDAGDGFGESERLTDTKSRWVAQGHAEIVPAISSPPKNTFPFSAKREPAIECERVQSCHPCPSLSAPTGYNGRSSVRGRAMRTMSAKDANNNVAKIAS